MCAKFMNNSVIPPTSTDLRGTLQIFIGIRTCSNITYKQSSVLTLNIDLQVERLQSLKIEVHTLTDSLQISTNLPVISAGKKLISTLEIDFTFFNHFFVQLMCLGE